jgi:xylulokinase
MLAALAAGCVVHGTVAVELGSTGVIAGVGAAPVIDYRGEIASLCSATGTWLGLGHHHQCRRRAGGAPPPLRLERRAIRIDGRRRFTRRGRAAAAAVFHRRVDPAPAGWHRRAAWHHPENFTPAHMARAAAEGVALGLGYAMSRLRELGFEPAEIRLLGPGAPAR